MAKRVYGTGSLYIKGASYYARWRTADGRQLNRKVGPVRPPGEGTGLTRPQAEREFRRMQDEEERRPSPARQGERRADRRRRRDRDVGDGIEPAEQAGEAVAGRLAAQAVEKVRLLRAGPERIVLRIDAARAGGEVIEELKALFESFPGRTEVVLEMATAEGTRRLRFGDDYRVDPSHALRAELDELLGPKALAA